MDSALRREIEELQRASVGQIRARYREVFQEEPRSKHRAHLFRRLAWRRELSGAVRKSEAVTLRHPVVPVADGFVGGFVRVYGVELRKRNAKFTRFLQLTDNYSHARHAPLC